MSQHDMNLENANGATFRADINSAVAALVSLSSGPSEPATKYAYQWWADTTSGILKRRNAANDNWISVMSLASGLIIGADVQAYNATLAGIASGSISVGGGKVQDFRLTLTSGVPVTTSDVTGATTIYCTPYRGNQISLYSAGAWSSLTSAQFSLALGTLTSGKPYDVFCYNNAGTPTLELLAWTNDTTRATALAYQDGVLVKSGDATRRYLGTFYTTAATTTEDSKANRYLWNYYNRVSRALKKQDATASWTWNTASFHQANASAANQVNFVQGVAEDSIELTAHSASASAGNATTAGIGIDSASVNSGSSGYSYTPAAGGSSMSVYRDAMSSAGRHYAAWLEYGHASGATFYGSGGAFGNTGIFGSILA